MIERHYTRDCSEACFTSAARITSHETPLPARRPRPNQANCPELDLTALLRRREEPSLCRLPFWGRPPDPWHPSHLYAYVNGKVRYSEPAGSERLHEPFLMCWTSLCWIRFAEYLAPSYFTSIIVNFNRHTPSFKECRHQTRVRPCHRVTRGRLATSRDGESNWRRLRQPYAVLEAEKATMNPIEPQENTAPVRESCSFAFDSPAVILQNYPNSS